MTQRIEIDRQMKRNNTVSAELEFRLVMPQQLIIPLRGTLFYSSEDPYAVRIAFYVGLNEPVEWICGRSLLSMGMEGHEGNGDVQVWPSAGSEGSEPGGVLNIKLFSSRGPAHFEASAKEISDFLRRAYQVVPDGEESDHIDVQTELDDLFR